MDVLVLLCSKALGFVRSKPRFSYFKKKNEKAFLILMSTSNFFFFFFLVRTLQKKKKIHSFLISKYRYKVTNHNTDKNQAG